MDTPLVIGGSASALLPAVLNHSFEAALSRDAADSLRASLAPVTSGSFAAFLMLSLCDSVQMVEALASVARDDGEDEVHGLVDAAIDVAANLAKIVEVAETVKARTLIAAHVALGVEWPSDADSAGEAA